MTDLHVSKGHSTYNILNISKFYNFFPNVEQIFAAGVPKTDFLE